MSILSAVHAHGILQGVSEMVQAHSMQILTEFCASAVSHFICTLHDSLQGAKALLLSFFFLFSVLAIAAQWASTVDIKSLQTTGSRKS